MTLDSNIIALADRSVLVHFDWPHRGVAPNAYIRGMAIAFARLYETLTSEAADDVVKKAVLHAVRDTIGGPNHDVLAWYAPELRHAGASTLTAADKLVALFTIMLGLGMQESSGRHCVGADTPEDRGAATTEENAEAGLFQISHDSIARDALRQSLFDAFRDRSDLLDIFGRGVSCRQADLDNHGNGAGAKFQHAMKRCPLFAVLYAAMYLRDRRSHWGPIIRKEAEAKPEAVQLFAGVQDLVDRANA